MEVEEEIKVRDLLTSWGVNEDTKNNFIDEEMDLFAIQHMDSESLTKLITTEGARIKFKTHREKWLKILHSTDKYLFGTEEPIISVENVSTVISTDNVPEVFYCELFNDCNEDREESASLYKESPESQTPAANELPEGEGSSPQNKRSNQYNLTSVLNGTTAGHVILKVYNRDREFTKDSTRDQLVDLILDEETRDDLGKTVSRDRLKFFAAEISKLFPTEQATTYFQSERHPATGKLVTSGKLVWRYYNRRRTFAKCGAISPRGKHIKATRSTNSQKVTIDNSTYGSICWLEQNRGNKGNWEDVVNHWQKTSRVRMNLLQSDGELNEEEVNLNDYSEIASTSKNSVKRKTVSKVSKQTEMKLRRKAAINFLTKYPAFQENSAYMLMEIDFKYLQPEVNSFALFTKWSTLSAFVVEQIQKKQPDFLSDPTLTDGEKNVLMLRALPKLFPIVSISGEKKSKKTWRPSHVEAADAFVLVVPSTLALEECKEAKRDQLVKLCMHLQPFVAVVGDIKNPDQYLICFDEYIYEVDSILQAVDLVFKGFFSLHLHYPSEAEQIWLFLQRSIYCFTTPEDRLFSAVATKVTEYARFEKKLADASHYNE